MFLFLSIAVFCFIRCEETLDDFFRSAEAFMGLCLSCKKTTRKKPSYDCSSAGVKDKTRKICGEINAPHICTTIEDVVNTKKTIQPTKQENQRMANSSSFNNMNIANSIRELVSKKRNRYIQDGFNLDLTYITPRIIAMGYPASNIEGHVYRNHIDDVVRFFDLKHKDRYKIYNLCSERSYDVKKFHDRVVIFPCNDHNPPKMDIIKPFCEDVYDWLHKNEGNVVAIHCKAGKGRTGTMICCFLLHCGKFTNANGALSFYGEQRTVDKKGVTIPSQVRYVKYYEKIVREKLNYKDKLVFVENLTFQPLPSFANGSHVVFRLSQDGKKSWFFKNKSCEVKKLEKSEKMTIDFDVCVPIEGDIKCELYSKSKLSKVKWLRFWFNTYFVQEEEADEDKGLILTLNKDELDIVSKKDKQNKTFAEDFKITLRMRKVPKKSESWLKDPQSVQREGETTTMVPMVNQQDNSPSGSSEGDDSSSDDEDEEYEESEWDSVVESQNNTNDDPRGVGYRLLSECELAAQLNEQHAKLLAA